MRQTVSYSEISSFQRCQYQHQLSYVERLKPVGRQDAAPMIGTLVHMGIASALMLYSYTDYKATDQEIKQQIDEKMDAWETLNPAPLMMDVNEFGELVFTGEIDAEYRNTIDKAANIAYRTIKYLNIPDNWRTITDESGNPFVEYRLVHPYDDNFDFVGVVDWVATDLRTGITYVVDWKTRGNFQEDEGAIVSGEDFNTQLSIYQYLLQQRGIEVKGSIIYQISSRVPEKPALLKEKKNQPPTMSRANIKTDWETYKAELEANGLNAKDYYDMRDKLSKAEFWRPVTIFRNAHEVQERWNTAMGWATLMHNDGVRLKNENSQCKYCPFWKICLAQDRGYDVDSLIELEYTKRVSEAEKEVIDAD